MSLDGVYPVAQAQAGLVNLQQISDAGVSRQQLRTFLRRGDIQRVLRSVYMAPEWAPKDFDARRARAAWAGLLASAPNGISTGACALHLHGIQGLPQRLTPEVARADGGYSSGVKGVRVRQFTRPFDVWRFGEWRVAAPVPAFVQALPEMDVDRAVAALDSGLNSNVITPADVDEIRRRLRGRRGVVALDPCWRLADGRAASPIETKVRLECVRGGVPPTDLQVVLRERGGTFIARGDLGWRRGDGTWVLAEVDGYDVHSAPEALFHDRSRQNRIVLHGRHTPLRFTSRDLGTGRIAAQVRAALKL